MQKIVATITKLLSCPVAMCSFIALVSAGSLAAALTAEVVFELEPCILCIYQRIPFVVALLLSLTGLLLQTTPLKNVLCKIKKGENGGHGCKTCTGKTSALIATCGLAFLINSVIATYHTGVERHWWRSAVEGCAVPKLGNTPQSILENILSAPTARCDEIPWADPILGLSMANYNVVLCFGLFIVCALSVRLIRQRPSHSE